MKIGSLLILILLIDLPAGPATLNSEEHLLSDPLGASHEAATNPSASAVNEARAQSRNQGEYY